MKTNPTQEEMDLFNKKWKERTKRNNDLPVIDPQVAKEYSEKIKAEPKTYSPEEAREIFRKGLSAATLKPVSEINKVMSEEETYKNACSIIRDYCFGFDNIQLKDRGGIYICGEPGTGKTCLLITACNILNNLSILKCNGWKRHNWFNMTNDISNKVKGQNPDLTYNIESSILIDDMT